MRILLMIVACLIIILTLLQGSKADGITAAFTGSSDLSLFAVSKDRGPEKVFSRVTYGLAIAFFVLVFFLK